VAFDYDERDEGVKEMIRLAVEGCRRNGIHSGLCGQAPSDYPDIAEYLVLIGIESMSLNPDTVLKTTQHVSRSRDDSDGGNDDVLLNVRCGHDQH
jgi:pyruvate,water dikinase